MALHRAGLAVITASIGIVFPGSATSQSAEDAETASSAYDCGTLALYTLLKLERRPTDLAALESRLPAPRPGGYSMQQLRNAARPFGLELLGVRLSKREGALDRPALVFLKDGVHGHFIVIRPIGQTGKLVQVLDTNQMPDVVDGADLYSSHGWTGLALIPDRPNWAVRALAALLIIAAALTLSRIVIFLRYRRRAMAGSFSP